MHKNLEQKESPFLSVSYLPEINKEIDEIIEDLFNLSLDLENNPESFFGLNDSFNFINYRNTFEISKAETNENTDKRFIISSEVLSGRKRKNNNNSKIHNKYFDDNILRKINVHYLNFIISFLNEVLSKCNIDDKFYENGKYKKIINKKNFNSIKNETIAQILVQDANLKFKNKSKNRELLDKIQNYNIEVLNRILSKKYISIFKELYYNNN